MSTHATKPERRLEGEPGTEATPLRFVTAASLFDGHDAAINVMRRLIQASGAEVVHLGHNRSVAEIVKAAVEEDADAIAVSSYQGGHVEYLTYMVDMLRERGAGHIAVFAGGGGTITKDEIAQLEAYGVERVYHPDDGLSLGLRGMIDDVVGRAARARVATVLPDAAPSAGDPLAVARMLSAIEDGLVADEELAALCASWEEAGRSVPVIGITGTGGAGKSTVTDELLSRFLQYLPDVRVAVVAVDPTRRRTGGALLGDRIRLNSLLRGHTYMRSLATRRQHSATSEVLGPAIAFLRACGFDLVLAETAGIGQSDS
ncbi:MAG: cobalamin-dependent protein, partial [Gaiella sp.]